MPSESLTGVVTNIRSDISLQSAPRPYRKRCKARIISRVRKILLLSYLFLFHISCFLYYIRIRVCLAVSGIGRHVFRSPDIAGTDFRITASGFARNPLFRSPGQVLTAYRCQPERAYFGVQFRLGTHWPVPTAVLPPPVSPGISTCSHVPI